MKKRIKQILCIFLVIILILPTAGCWDNNDINKKEIVISVVADKKDGKYVLYIETTLLKASQGQGSSSSEKKFLIVKGSGNSFAECRSKIESQIEQTIYVGSVEAVFITERLAKDDGIYEFLFRIVSDFKYRKKAIVLIVSEEPEKFYKINENGESAGGYVINQLETNHKLGHTFLTTTAEYIEYISGSYTGFAIPKLGVKENIPEITGYCVFNNKYKCVGSIDVADSKGLNYILLDQAKPKFLYVLPYNNVLFTTKVEMVKRKIKTNYVNGEISFDINMGFKAEFMYSNRVCAVSNEVFNKLKKELELTIKREIEKTIKTSKEEYKTDYLDLSCEFHYAFPKDYHHMDWVKEYPKVKTNVNVKIDLKEQLGMDYSTRAIE